jgi:hypothetical protein
MFKLKQSSPISFSAAPIFLGALGSLRLSRDVDSAHDLELVLYQNMLFDPTIRQLTFPRIEVSSYFNI